jgi:ribosomal protein S18 acetylase RimI-like enzyme
VIIRDARAEDVPDLARLLVQLYADELPGMLRGDPDGQAALARRVLEAVPLGVRYVIDRDGRTVGMGSLATVEEPRPPIPPRVLLSAPRDVGLADGVMTILGGARGLFSIAALPAPDEGQIHSVVVGREHRGRGLGTAMLAHLEREALARGKRRAVLAVVASNLGALRLYRAAGYAEAPVELGPVRRRIAYPGIMMWKAL